MAKVKIISPEGQASKTMNLEAAIFEHPINPNLYYEAVKATQIGKRLGTSSTKTRAEVRGGKTRKPWRQKGTGRARAGTLVSPLRRGGGIIFGPKPKEYRIRLPKKIRRGAIASAFSEALRDNRLKVVENYPIPEAKTKLMAAFLEKIECGRKTLILYDNQAEAEIARAARNIPSVRLSHYGRLNIVELLEADSILLSKETLKKLQGLWKK